MTTAIYTLLGLWAVGIAVVGWCALRAGALADREMERQERENQEGPKC